MPGDRLAVMFVPELVYTAPPEAVDAVLAEHVVGLDEQYRQGVFLASGRTDRKSVV